MYPMIRFERIELKNFKNVKQGFIETVGYRNKLFYTHVSDVLGIYGQNGSGKTAVVEALDVAKSLMSGEPLAPQVKDLIHKEAVEASLKFVFYMEDQTEEEEVKRYLIHYDVTLRKASEEEMLKEQSIYVSSEKIGYSCIGVKGRTDILNYNYHSTNVLFLPKIRLQELGKVDKDAEVNLQVAKRLAYKERTSFIFQKDVVKLFLKNEGNKEHGRILFVLSYYARMNLFVVKNRNIAETGIRYMPISFRLTLDDLVTSGIAPISLVGASVISSSSLTLIRLVIQQMNLVLKSILPGMHVELQELGTELAKDGSELIRVELLSVKDAIQVPLKYESEGIKKILSILSTLISVYNNPSICLVVDELDSGIYEYLLGELLAIIEKHGKGQLLFTSHNLRALEKLHKDSIIISTTNPFNRFVRIPHEKGHRNYRNSYLRSIDLGGLDEEIYKMTNSYEISYAFRKAGDIFDKE